MPACIKAVIFDLDNTLLDFVKMKDAAIGSAVDAMIEAGLAVQKEDAVQAIKDIYNVLTLAEFGVVGIITGKALYSGTLNLKEAIDLAKNSQ